MARILDEKRNINENVFEYEQRLQSPYNRYIDKFPTYVTYYHINNEESTVDEGWKDSEETIGPNSSLRFQKITDFPLYGIQQIVVDLNEDDQGLDGSYSGEGVVLPHTIKPLQNDYFVINHLERHDVYIFRIDAIEYDNIHPDNFYKVTFRLEETDASVLDLLEKQVANKYVCIAENIGTENCCIIESERFERIDLVKKMYENIRSTYMSIFYNERYNCLMGDKRCGKKLYDPFLIEFVNKHGLFNDKNSLTTYVFSQEIEDNRFSIKYEKSVWRFIERQDPSLLQKFYYYEYPGITLPYTTFAIWVDQSVVVTDISLTINTEEDCKPIFTNDFIETVQENKPDENDYVEFLKKYIRKESMDAYEIPLTLHEMLLNLNANLDCFYITPMILYIIQKILKEETLDHTMIGKTSLSV